MAAVVFISNFVFLLMGGIVSVLIYYVSPGTHSAVSVVISYAALIYSTWYAVRYIEKRSVITEKNIVPVALMAVAPVVVSQLFIAGVLFERMGSYVLTSMDVGSAVSDMTTSFFIRDAITVFSVFIFMRMAIAKKVR